MPLYYCCYCSILLSNLERVVVSNKRRRRILHFVLSFAVVNRHCFVSCDSFVVGSFISYSRFFGGNFEPR